LKSDTPSLDHEEFARGDLSEKKVDRLWHLVLSDAMALESDPPPMITCPRAEPPTRWTLTSTANDRIVSEYTCGTNELPSMKPTLRKIAKTITSVTYITQS
ncbi:MAG: hypothetical protein H0T78_00945, partial [Longispora sp.]|nr:hypothetical protein [Longispora sp. (in: high G+C Gram-positive bacteria)]